jgi:hypothetical protein
MYLPASCTDSRNEVASPDDEAGLHVRSHDGRVVRVAARKDQLLFQVGQSLQVPPSSFTSLTDQNWAEGREYNWRFPSVPIFSVPVDVFIIACYSMTCSQCIFQRSAASVECMVSPTGGVPEGRSMRHACVLQFRASCW